ncbi:MAG: hypothetical protein R3183_10845 [Oleiphilaceae bacterium]|nr:hypothetical protein [Oleiphilaceae bacterium]
MLMNRVTAIVMMAGTTILIGCGGSGTPIQSSTEQQVAINLVAGIYETSRANDTAYLYLASNGNVTAYDYQQDAVGTGDNCYTVSTASTQINSTLNGGTLSVNTTTDVYTITSGVNTLDFTYSTTNGMQNFDLNGSIQGATGLDINAGGLNVKVGDAGAQKTSLLITDITAALCP